MFFIHFTFTDLLKMLWSRLTHPEPNYPEPKKKTDPTPPRAA